jgi:hypothetical protein
MTDEARDGVDVAYFFAQSRVDVAAFDALVAKKTEELRESERLEEHENALAGFTPEQREALKRWASAVNGWNYWLATQGVQPNRAYPLFTWLDHEPSAT